MRVLGSALLAVAGVTAPLAAQAPVITPDGDPSVDSDTIYALHVDPADYPDESVVVLLDDGVVRREADGRGSETYRTVVQVLRRDAVENWSEYSFTWPEGQETFRLNWIRVLDLEGNVLSGEPSQQQETTVPAAEQYPVYVDTRVLRASLARVAPGTIVDYSYTRETIDPVLEGDFSSSWLVNPGTPVVRSRLILDLPAELEPRITEENLDFERTEEVIGGRRVLTWATADVPGFEPEPFAGYPNDVSMSIAYSGAIAWDDVAAWYVELARDRFDAAPEAVAAAQPFVAGAPTLDDTLRAMYRWIAQDIRYVSLSLGIGGYQPRPPAEVVETKFGDCKDKATLFLALARHFGVTVHPVLVALSGAPDSLHPSFRQFDHMIAAIEAPDGYQYVDLTAELVPYDQTPPYLEGEIGVLVRPDGTAQIVTFPETAPEANRNEIRITGELDAAGSFTGRMEMRTFGSAQYSLRDALSESAALTSTERERFARNVANSLFEGATPDSLELFDGRDLAAEPTLALDLRAPSVTSRSGSAHILPLPLPTYYSRNLIAELESRDERRFPIDIAEVNSPSVETYVMEFKLPTGWQAELPAAVTATGLFGTYESTYEQEGRMLRIRRSLAGPRADLAPADSIGALIEWMRRVADDDVAYVVIREK